jgi:hypothetical protein
MLDCLIIGGGPAGLLAALYLGRYCRTVRVIDAGESRAAKIPKSHNYPGFFGIGGPELLRPAQVPGARPGESFRWRCSDLSRSRSFSRHCSPARLSPRALPAAAVVAAAAAAAEALLARRERELVMALTEPRAQSAAAALTAAAVRARRRPTTAPQEAMEELAGRSATPARPPAMVFSAA